MNNHTSAPSNTALIWLISGISLCALPHFFFQPLWVMALFVGMIFWRVKAISSGWSLPHKKISPQKLLHIAIAVLAFALLFYSYGNLIGRDAGVGLLTVMLGLKLVEVRTHRDFYVTCFLGYFLVVTNFFYSQNIPTAFLMCLVVIVMTASMISLNDPSKTLSHRKLFTLSSHLLLQALPMMLLLFVLFPRISGPLWGLPEDAHSSTTGISDSMTLGNISQLIESDEIAFRVKFDGDRPPASARYWRGPVLWQTDGTTWRELSYSTAKTTPPDVVMHDQPYQYTTTLEPHNQRWLFALDFPNQIPANVPSHFTYDGELRSLKPINQRVQLALTSSIEYQLNPTQDRYLEHALQLPNNKHPRTRELALTWKSTYLDPEALIQHALSYFNENAFFYTLSPAQLGGDTIDNFMFETREGFCEHYAASFTILMRAAGIPARVVTGYLGGEINPVDDYLIVRQRDAHAWVEVWLEGEGWKRIDPTSAVSEERIQQGINTLLPAGFNAPALLPNSDRLLSIWQTLKNNWDALDNSWNQWVLAYGPELQKQVLEKLGMSSPNWQTMALWLGYGLALFSISLAVFLFKTTSRKSPLIRVYEQFCQKAEKAGYARLPHQGPLAFATQLKRQYPDMSQDIDHITALYIDLRYGQQSVDLAELKVKVRKFKFSK
jgi:transglutaminase-like putative cysteine protease